MRSVIEANWRMASRPDWPRPDERSGLLRDHISVDFESLAVDVFQALLDNAVRQAPQDDRVWLGWANLAIRTGAFAEARRRLDDCLRIRPEDPAVWQAVLDWGLATEQVAEVRRALSHLPAEGVPPGRVEDLRAWLASRRGDAAAERKAPSNARAEPGRCAAWERLAVLAAEAGQAAEAVELRRRKTEMAQGSLSKPLQSESLRRRCADSPDWPRPWAVGSKPSAS